MDQNINKEIEFKSRCISFLKKKKKIIIFSIISLFLLISATIFFSLKEKKNHVLISEKFIIAGNFLKKNEEEIAKKIYIEIINSENKFYSILALNVILEKNLIDDKNEILKYFDLIENLKISRSKKDLLLFKKSLYLIENNDPIKGKNILKKLIEKNSQIKSLAENVLAN